MFEDIGQRYAIDDADGDLTYNTRLNHLCGNPFCKGKEKEERNDDKDLNNCMILVEDRMIGT